MLRVYKTDFWVIFVCFFSFILFPHSLFAGMHSHGFLEQEGYVSFPSLDLYSQDKRSTSILLVGKSFGLIFLAFPIPSIPSIRLDRAVHPFQLLLSEIIG
ncbi:hypothetical protein PCK2_000999 [Pneumocystis canis]|nr:hypothetical protein PCK2_000999 [Pneumocystis canis]